MRRKTTKDAKSALSSFVTNTLPALEGWQYAEATWDPIWLADNRDRLFTFYLLLARDVAATQKRLDEEDAAFKALAATTLLSTIRPYAVALGYPVTTDGLASCLDDSGARRVEALGATVGDPAYLVESLAEPLRRAIESAGPEMLAFLRLQASTPRGIERAYRHRAVVSGHPDIVFIMAEAMRMTPEDLMIVLLNGDAIPTRLSEEVAIHFGVDLDWLLCRDMSAGTKRH